MAHDIDSNGPPVKWYNLAPKATREQCLDEARRWVAESGRVYSTGSNTGFAVGAVAEYICNSRYNMTISTLRTPESKAFAEDWELED